MPLTEMWGFLLTFNTRDMQQQVLLEKLVNINQQQMMLNKEMVKNLEKQLAVRKSLNNKIYTVVQVFQNQDIPSEHTNSLLPSLSKLFENYNHFVVQYSDSLKQQIKISKESADALSEGYLE